MMPEYIYRPPQRPHSFGPTPLASSHYRDRAELSESRFGGGGWSLQMSNFQKGIHTIGSEYL